MYYFICSSFKLRSNSIPTLFRWHMAVQFFDGPYGVLFIRYYVYSFVRLTVLADF
jgi:hypothetical protein